MVLTAKIESDALLVCLAHAMSTEGEEVMGLLIGEIADEIAHVHAVIMLRRSDKRKDRVEISPEQLSSASSQAEVIGTRTRANHPMRIIGWYHSHPHITVWPSHVDVRTQAMYQMMDRDFIGIIVSCFNEDPSTSIGQVQVTCFQAMTFAGHGGVEECERVEIDMEIVPAPSLCEATLASLVELPSILSQEEEESYQRTLGTPQQDLTTAIHNATVYTRSLCQLMETVLGPLINSYENKHRRNVAQIGHLNERKKALEAQLFGKLPNSQDVHS